MLKVKIEPPGGEFTEFVRITIQAFDDGIMPISTPPWEIVYTTDGTIPAVDISGNPLGTSKKALSPITKFPIEKPTTIRCFAIKGTTTSPIVSAYFDLFEVLAKNEIRTAPPPVVNYTLKITEGDLVRNDRGSYDIVWGAQKAAQDVREVLLVEDVPEGKSVNTRTLPRFGSALSRLVGSALPAGLTRGKIQTAIFRAVSYLSELQQQENVPEFEQIRRIQSLSVDASSDMTHYTYDLIVELVTGETVRESGIIRNTVSN